MINKRITTYVLTCSVALLLTACGTTNNDIYYWGAYPSTVYENLKNDKTSLSEQISAMEKYFDLVNSQNKAVAPGAHAHLGLLLIEAGQNDRALEQFKIEKELFPESSTFMDFLLKNKMKEDKK